MCISDDGHVLKVLNAGRGVNGHMEPVIVEDIPVFSGKAVTGLRIVYTRRHGDGISARRLIVMSRDELRSLPLQRCARANTCSYVTPILTCYDIVQCSIIKEVICAPSYASILTYLLIMVRKRH